MSRITREQMLMEMAIVASKRSTCNRKHIGAVIARNSRPVSLGYVGSPPGTPHCTDAGCILGPDGGCIRTTHAEANAIAFAARAGIETAKAELYTTVSPCPRCAALIIAAGITEVYYLEKYRLTEGLDMLTSVGIYHDQIKFQLEL